MKNLSSTKEADELIERINKLSPDTKPLWGKMTVSQMLAHSQSPLNMAVGDKKYKRGLMGFLFGKIAKKQMVSEKPFKQNLPTDKNFKVSDTREFYSEKNKLIDLIKRFIKTDRETLAKTPHGFFGKLTADEWDLLQYKHLDHHLHQFGV